MGKTKEAAAGGKTSTPSKPRASIDKKKDTPAKLLEKGRCDKDDIMRATEMTKETWKKLQVGMAEKWPVPEYMKNKKVELGPYRDETFSIVTKWTAETLIEYRPHAKAPGSKSHLRYESYSKAKTVGEALALSSYPIDWCHDYEHGFIRVVGGVIRHEPLDTTAVAKDGGTLTEVDEAISSWYKKELAKILGIKVKDLSDSAGADETAITRAQRLIAQKEAKERLIAADLAGRWITDEEVYLTLKRWAFGKNVTRVNVMPDGQDWVFSDTMGLLRDRIGDVHRTASVRRYPQVAELLVRWFTDRVPPEANSFTFTSMNLNCNYAAALHRDKGNFGPSFISAFGDFTGGELNYWPEDAGGDLEALPPKGSKTTASMNIHGNLVLFNGNSAHSVNDFTGTRYSVVYFTVSCHAKATADDITKLRQLGIPYPAADEDPYKILRAPRSKAPVATPARANSGETDKPSHRFWSTAELEKHRVQKSAGEIQQQAAACAARRLEPENARSFYGPPSVRAANGN